jgi:hypothetical protein
MDGMLTTVAVITVCSLKWLMLAALPLGYSAVVTVVTGPWGRHREAQHAMALRFFEAAVTGVGSLLQVTSDDEWQATLSDCDRHKTLVLRWPTGP